MAKPDKYALLSVADRTGIVDFAYALSGLGFKIIAAGGTASALKQSELEILELSDLFKTPPHEGPFGLLRPEILAGIAADREDPKAVGELERSDGVLIDLVAANLYPMSAVLGETQLSQQEILTYVDLAGSSLLRAAARNFRQVLGLCDPDDYQSILEALRHPLSLTAEKRQALAAKAFHYSAYYDSTVAQYLGGKWEKLPDEFVIALKKTVEFNYGENPQQQASLYALSGARAWGLTAANLIYGKPPSYNHYLDLEAAWELAGEIEDPCCAIVKHAVPAGVAVSEKLAEAAREAYRCDPRGCFRGTVAVNRELGEDAAAFFAEEVVGMIVAPQFSPQALSILKSKKDIRLVTLPSTLISAREMDFKAVPGGMLVQDRDNRPFPDSVKVVTRRHPTELEAKSLRLAWHVAKHARTHAAVLCRGSNTLGIGSGQTSRLDAFRVALAKSQERHPILTGGLPIVMASDGALAAEHVAEAAQSGVGAIIQPGGTIEDKDAVEAADRAGIAMILTGLRHFRH